MLLGQADEAYWNVILCTQLQGIAQQETTGQMILRCPSLSTWCGQEQLSLSHLRLSESCPRCLTIAPALASGNEQEHPNEDTCRGLESELACYPGYEDKEIRTL